MSEFLEMGGYAPYVWTSYGLAAVVMLGLLAGSWVNWRRQERILATLKTARAKAPRPAEEAA